jgi:hypothetical protein
LEVRTLPVASFQLPVNAGFTGGRQLATGS